MARPLGAPPDTMLRRLALFYSKRARAKRAKLFWRHLQPSQDDRILDLGSEDGSYIAALIPFRENIYIADIEIEPLIRGNQRFGFHTVLLDSASPSLPFPDSSFDIVFTSSVIEHATGDKKMALSIEADQDFVRAAYAAQRAFANEVRRISKHYFVQTPYKYAPVESHTWLPFIIIMLPRRWQKRIIRFLNGRWPKGTIPDWNLLTKRQMRELFPDAELVSERWFGLTRSLMAIKSKC